MRLPVMAAGSSLHGKSGRHFALAVVEKSRIRDSEEMIMMPLVYWSSTWYYESLEPKSKSQIWTRDNKIQLQNHTNSSVFFVS